MRPEHIAIQHSNHVMVLDWDDGLHQRISFEELRRACPCASCKQLDSSRTLTAEETDLRSVQATGAYAVSLQWADGHRFGIYTWELLRSIATAPKDGQA